MNNGSAIPVPAQAPAADPSQFGDYSEWAQGEMAKGFSADELRSTLSQSGVQLPQAAPAAAPQSSAIPSGKEPSWWQKLLPTAGGIIGGIGGGVLTAGMGGEFAGAAAGGALGQAIENALTGKKVIQGNDVTAGIENGVGAGVGGMISKAGGAVVKGVAGAAGKAVESRAAQVTADEAAQAAANTAKTEAAAKAAEIQRLADEFKVTTGTGDLASRTGDVVANLQKLGIEKPMAADAVKVGNVLTGSNENGAGILNHVKQQILQDAGGHVNIGQIGDNTTASGKLFTHLKDPTVQAELGDPLDPKGQSAAAAILNKFDMLANGAGVPAEGAGTITPGSGFKLLTDVSAAAREAQQAASRASATTADAAKAHVWNSLRDNLKSALYDRPEVHSSVAGFKVTPELESQIDKKIAAEGIDDPAVAANLKQTIMHSIDNGSNMQDYLTVEHGGVGMHQVGNSALKQQGNISAASTQRLSKGALADETDAVEPDLAPAPGKGGMGTALLDMAAVGGIPMTGGMSLIGLAPHLLSAAKNPGVQEAAYKGLEKATSSTVAKKVIPTLIRSGSIAAANAPNIAANSAIPSGDAQGANMNPQQPPAVSNPLATGYESLLRQEQAAPTVLGPQFASVLASLMPQLQQQQQTAATVGNLEPAYNAAGGPSGFGGGVLNEIIARMVPGSAQATYSAQQTAAAAQLAKLLGITPEQAMQMLPQMTQTQTSAIPSQQNVGSVLNTLTAPAQ